METIFIQIASYKDPELPKTIANCIAKATFPGRLTFGICWQKMESESLGQYLEDNRFRIHTVDWKQAKGVGWARSICNSLYKYEDFTLQIDSHHRFDDGWDVQMIEQWKACKHPKAVLSGYPPGYIYNSFGKEVLNYMPPMTMIVKGFDQGFLPTFKSGCVKRNVNIKAPFRGSFIAAGFFFTIGKVCEEVPYAKEVYFTGEEYLYSLRLFTFGYRVYYPNKWLLWHLYERKNQDKHWDNFTKDEDLKKDFTVIQNKSTEFLTKALGGKLPHLFGKVNSFADFNVWSGVNIPLRVLHPNMLKGFEPPFEAYKGWEDRVKPVREYYVDLQMKIDEIPEHNDYTFWYFGLHDKDCNEIFRNDVRIENGAEFGKHPVSYNDKILAREMPVKYVIWPHSKAKGWLERLVYDIPVGAIKQL